MKARVLHAGLRLHLGPEALEPHRASAQAIHARRLRRDGFGGRIFVDHEAELPSATAGFMDDFEACIAHLRMPITRLIRSGDTSTR